MILDYITTKIFNTRKNSEVQQESFKISGNQIKQSSLHNKNIIIPTALDLICLISILRQRKIDKITESDDMHHRILQRIENFTTTLIKLNVSDKQIYQAKYLICAAIDESATTDKSLIDHFYKEMLGGEKFFKIIENVYLDIPNNFELIKLSYLLLCLGFKGKYGLAENGDNILKEIKNKIYLLITRCNSRVLANSDVKINELTKMQSLNFSMFPHILIVSVIILSSRMIFSNLLDKQSVLIEQLITQTYVVQ
jgi:type IV/VI secretion system ImpK/VasF family protein